MVELIVLVIDGKSYSPRKVCKMFFYELHKSLLPALKKEKENGNPQISHIKKKD